MKEALLALFVVILMSFSLDASGKTTTRRPTTIFKPHSKAQQKCLEYSKQAYGTTEKCYPDKQSTIVGGENATANEFPHMVHIKERPTHGEVTPLCGGSLISQRFVLSAAHCVRYPGVKLSVRLGVLYSNIDKYKPVILRVVKAYIHHDYADVPGNGKPYNDVALLELERDVRFTRGISPACLHTDFDIPSTHAIASGWGNTAEGGSRSPILKKNTLKLIDMANCERMFNNIGFNLTDGIINEDMIVCAGGEIGQSVCHGDSGGPLQLVLTEPPCMYSIVGLTSWAKGCARETPSVFTRVSNYISWIENIVWP